MPRSRRLTFAILLILCVGIAPFHGSSRPDVANDVTYTIIEQEERDIAESDGSEEDSSRWRGILFPTDRTLSAGLFSRGLRA
jgi:hypothetical protein